MDNQPIPKKVYTCKTHGDWEATLIPSFPPEPGKFITPVCPVCVESEMQEQDRLSGQSRQTAVEKSIGKAGIGKRFHGKTFENYIATSLEQKKALQVAIRWMSSINERIAYGDSLIFHGNPGTGKSHLAAAIVQGALCAGKTALYMSVYDLVFTLRESYKNNAPSFKEELQLLVYPQVLVIDEVGAEIGKGKEDVTPINAVIDARYQAQRPTIIISNLGYADLTAHIGERMISRLREGKGVVVAFDWSDYRIGEQKSK